MPTAAEVLILLAAVVGSGSMTAAGVFLWFRTKRLTRENDELRSLTSRLETMGDELGETRQQVAELYERVEFAERLLTKGRETGV